MWMGAEAAPLPRPWGSAASRLRHARHALNKTSGMGSGAEQDRYAAHFGFGADGWARARHEANAQGGGSGAEQVSWNAVGGP
jgi:hypothetical protein